MNGATGYRAPLSSGDFNQSLIDAVAPMLFDSERRHQGRFSRQFLEQPLIGPHSKFWFPKELSDPSAKE